MSTQIKRIVFKANPIVKSVEAFHISLRNVKGILSFMRKLANIAISRVEPFITPLNYVAFRKVGIGPPLLVLGQCHIKAMKT